MSWTDSAEWVYHEDYTDRPVYREASDQNKLVYRAVMYGYCAGKLENHRLAPGQPLVIGRKNFKEIEKRYRQVMRDQ